MRERIHYTKSKEGLYGALEVLRKMLVDNQSYLASLSSNSELSGRGDIDSLIGECLTKQTAFESQSMKIEELRRLAGEATLHPGNIL